MQEESALVVDPITNNNAGSLIDHYVFARGRRQAFARLVHHDSLSNDDVFDTDTYPRSVQLASIVAGLPAEIAYLGQGVIDIAGGQPFPGTTEADVAAARKPTMTSKQQKPQQMHFASKCGREKSLLRNMQNTFSLLLMRQ